MGATGGDRTTLWAATQWLTAGTGEPSDWVTMFSWELLKSYIQTNILIEMAHKRLLAYTYFQGYKTNIEGYHPFSVKSDIDRGASHGHFSYNVYMPFTWWRHQMETSSALLALCAGNSPVTGEFPAKRPVTQSMIISLVCARINAWVNSLEAGDLIRHRAHYDVIVMSYGTAKHIVIPDKVWQQNVLNAPVLIPL